jgi:hypothetical protein
METGGRMEGYLDALTRHSYCKPRMVLDRRGEGERRMQFSNYCGLIKIARCGFPFLTSGRPMTSPVISSNRDVALRA